MTLKNKEFVLYDPTTNEIQVTSYIKAFSKVKAGNLVIFEFSDKKTKKTIITLGPFLYLGAL